MEQGAHQSLQQTSQVSRQPQFHHQGGEHEEGEQGGNYDVVAQGQAAFGRLHGGLGIEHQGQGGAQQGQTQEQVTSTLSLDNSLDIGFTSVLKWYAWRKGCLSGEI